MNKKDINHGTKFDTDKPRFDLIPPDAELWLAKVLEFGARKYADNNWTGLNVSRVIGALKRHLNAIERGEDIDDESGMPHHAHLLTNAMFLSHLLENYPKQDDRSFKHLNINDVDRQTNTVINEINLKKLFKITPSHTLKLFNVSQTLDKKNTARQILKYEHDDISDITDAEEYDELLKNYQIVFGADVDPNYKNK